MKKIDFSGLASSIDELEGRDQMGKILYLDPDKEILVSPQVRRAFHEVERLAEMILKEGQTDAVKVHPKDHTGRYPLLHGENRQRAVSLLRSQGHPILLKAELVQKPLTESERVALQATNNIHRNDLNPIEIGMALTDYRRLREQETGQKVTNGMLAERFGRDDSWVSKYLAMSDLPECIVSLVFSRLTSDIELLGDLKQYHRLDKEACENYCQEIIKGDTSLLTRKYTRNLVATLKGRVTPPSEESTPSDPIAPSLPTPQGDSVESAKISHAKITVPEPVEVKPAPLNLSAPNKGTGKASPQGMPALHVRFKLEGKSIEGILLSQKPEDVTLGLVQYKSKGTAGVVSCQVPLKDLTLLRWS
ncbi:MAG: hypothetical protein RL095_446 [Verrucomicrobiota bacterium]|jgi:ParB family chromosome partitioning protein